MKKVVIDTGVIVSAFLKPGSVPRKAFEIAITKYQPLISVETLTELEEVLGRPKLKKLFPIEDQFDILKLIVLKSQYVEVTSKLNLCRDHDDDKFINLAIDGQADLILTGDSDLLILQEVKGISILEPSEFVMEFEGE